MKPNSLAGFTLIEIIGVLAIIAILASAITPNMVHEIRRATMEAEDKTLETMTDALGRFVIDNKSLPGTALATWSAAVVPYMSVPIRAITTNRTDNPRRLISRPTNDLGGVPYDQTTSFSMGPLPQGNLPITLPLQARYFLLSNLRNTVSAAALSNAQFDAVWNQNGTIPNGFTESIDLRIMRLALTSLFYPVTVNCSSVANVPRWALETAAAKSLNNGAFTVYLISGTRITLYTGAVSQGTIIVDRPRGITYNGTAWSY